MKARRFCSRASGANDRFPIGACTIPLLSTRNSIFPAFNSVTALATSIVTVPALGFGIRPRGPSTLPSGPRAHHVGGGDDHVGVEPAVLDLLHVLDPDEVGPRRLRLLRPVALGDHQHADLL